jgi:hypothetical protein
VSIRVSNSTTRISNSHTVVLRYTHGYKKIQYLIIICSHGSQVFVFKQVKYLTAQKTAGSFMEPDPSLRFFEITGTGGSFALEYLFPNKWNRRVFDSEGPITNCRFFHGT